MIGQVLGHYQILSKLGEGGMGEVYRARDTTLKRDVALKVIPDIFAKDDERMARFVREAQMLAALNHVNIAAIYGVEQSDTRRALVLELVDGETLADRISRGPIATREALPIALQIAAALEEAHERNIIHRDLKPANVKVNSQGIVKVLDFGLARALEDPQEGSNPSDSPTMTIGGTRAGMILGTAGYMAPEQARGKPVDRRADVWAFGVVLFEMFSGQQAFGGETITDSLAKVLEREPDWSRLPASTPVAIRKLLERCLTKNVRDRLQAIGDARTTLQEVIADPSPKVDEAAAVRPMWRTLLPWAAAPLFLAAGWLLKPAPEASPSQQTRFELPLPAGQSLVHQYRHGVDVSSDGSRVVFVAQRDSESGEGERSRLYLKFLNQWDATPIPGTEGGTNPAFSPDGQSIAFMTNGGPRAPSEIRKVSLTGGVPIPLAVVTAPMGITWGSDGIVFGSLIAGLSVIRDGAGEPQPFTELDKAALEVSHRLPHVLPDGSAVIFTVLRHKTTTPNWAQAQIWVKSIETGERKLLLENGVDARYAGNGQLVFARMGKLFAVPFDSESLTVTGRRCRCWTVWCIHCTPPARFSRPAPPNTASRMTVH
jgi:serine/threonine protein kinase